MEQSPPFNHFIFSIANGGRDSRGESAHECIPMCTCVITLSSYTESQLHIHFNRYWMILN